MREFVIQYYIEHIFANCYYYYYNNNNNNNNISSIILLLLVLLLGELTVFYVKSKVFNLNMSLFLTVFRVASAMLILDTNS